MPTRRRGCRVGVPPLSVGTLARQSANRSSQPGDGPPGSDRGRDLVRLGEPAERQAGGRRVAPVPLPEHLLQPVAEVPGLARVRPQRGQLPLERVGDVDPVVGLDRRRSSTPRAPTRPPGPPRPAVRGARTGCGRPGRPRTASPRRSPGGPGGTRPHARKLRTGEEVSTSCGPDPADLPGDVPAQLVGDGELAVRVAEEGHVGHPDRRGRRPLLRLAQRRHPLPRGVVEAAGVPVRGDAVGHLDAARRSTGRDRPGRAVVDVVGVGHHGQHALGHGRLGAGHVAGSYRAVAALGPVRLVSGAVGRLRPYQCTRRRPRPRSAGPTAAARRLAARRGGAGGLRGRWRWRSG